MTPYTLAFHGYDRGLDHWLDARSMDVAKVVEDTLLYKRPTFRYYYRCEDCLLPMTFDTKKEAVDCPACNGVLEYLGVVRRHRVVGVRYEIPCDARCTGASGPQCDCPCGGENHGTGRLVERDVDKGVTRTNITEGELDERRAFAKRWRETRRTLLERAKALRSPHPGRASILLRKLTDMKSLKTIRGREKALADALSEGG